MKTETKMKTFPCSCGAMISPPQESEIMFLGQIKGNYKISISYQCENEKCRKVWHSNFSGQIENAGFKR